MENIDCKNAKRNMILHPALWNQMLIRAKTQESNKLDSFTIIEV